MQQIANFLKSGQVRHGQIDIRTLITHVQRGQPLEEELSEDHALAEPVCQTEAEPF